MWRCTILATALLLVALATPLACQVTWREPEIQQPNPVVVFPSELARVCAQLRDTIGLLGTMLQQDTVERDACLFESAQIELTGSGDPVTRLEEVAYVGSPSPFSRGRYVITASVRLTAQGNTRVHLATRIEGFNAEYRVVRSRGLIERTVIERLAELLGVEPIDE